MPEGSILDPVLFLIFINDIDVDVISSILKFADDTKVFFEVNNDQDRIKLKDYLNKLSDWSHNWQMPFIVNKCKVMHFDKNNLILRTS